jgi:predicted phosphodiesterase
MPATGTAWAIPMTILHVTDFHFNLRWFDWLRRHAPPHDLTVMSGDLLDHAAATPARRQIEWVRDWLEAYPRALCVCSGNDDLEWDAAAERWAPAYWLRSIANPLVRTDGEGAELDGLTILNLGVTTRPKGGAADAWVVHAAPSGTRVARRASGVDGGDPDLVPAIRVHAPRLVMSGHVHDPRHWREQRDGTLFLNPGRGDDGAWPHHILIDTDGLHCRFVAPGREETFTPRFPATTPVVAAGETTLVA